MIPIDILILEICKYLKSNDILSLILSCKFYLENSTGHLEILILGILLLEISDIYDFEVYNLITFNDYFINDLPMVRDPIQSLVGYSHKKPFRYKNKYYYIPKSCLIEKDHLIAEYIGHSYLKTMNFLSQTKEKYLFINIDIEYDIFLLEAFGAINEYLSLNTNFKDKYIEYSDNLDNYSNDIIESNKYSSLIKSNNYNNSDKVMKRIYFLLHNRKCNISLLQNLMIKIYRYT